MSLLELPHTAGCLVCGPSNPHGLKLSLHVDPASGHVRVDYEPAKHHNGFEGIVHGGALATVIDEAMVWAATWAGKRFCVCGEMTVRYRTPAVAGQTLRIEARVETSRAKLILTTAEALDARGNIVATASGKYVPVSIERNRDILATFLDAPHTAAAAGLLRSEP